MMTGTTGGRKSTDGAVHATRGASASGNAKRRARVSHGSASRDNRAVSRQLTETAICFGLASSFSGRVMVSTPSLKSARTLSVSTRDGSEKDRLNVP